MRCLRTILVLVLVARAEAAPFEDQPTLRAMKDELARSMDKLELPGFGKPYFLSYELYDMDRTSVTASLGALVYSDVSPYRTIDIDLRVGDATLDNSNFGDNDRSRSVTLPIEDDYNGVRRALWLATDRQYKHAVEMLERKRAVAKAETKNPDDVGAWSKEPPSHIVDDHPAVPVEQGKLEALAKRLSAVFRSNADVHGGTVSIAAASTKQYFVSSEGSASMQSGSFVRIDVECESQADDGMPVRDSLHFFVERFDQLPPEQELVAKVEDLSRELSAIRTAPVVDDYSGPLVFDDLASGQVIRMLLAENLAGTPAPKSDRPGAHSVGESELVSKIGQRVFPQGVSVIDDPTSKQVGKLVLAGAARFDEEGVPTQKVSLVENGMFKRFLMSRIPRKGFEHSNGHAASSPIAAVRAHPSNLIVSTSKGVSEAQLRARAFALAKDQGLDYIVVVDKLDLHRVEDFDPSMSDASIPKASVMKRVYANGKQELVRGGTFGAVPLQSLKDVVAMGTTPTVYSYTGIGVGPRYERIIGDSPLGYFVSIASPSLLFRDVEVKKPHGPQRTGPIAPRPK